MIVQNVHLQYLALLDHLDLLAHLEDLVKLA